MDVVNAEKAPMENKSREKVNRRNRKREKYVPSSEPLELPFCRICGKRASGIHFGVYSCEACKAFFRRCLQRTSPYKCDKGGNCIIDEQQKGLNCSACRLKKCQELGMSKEGIRQGRYTVAERTNVIMEVKKLHKNGILQQNQCQNSVTSEPNGRLSVPSDSLSPADSSINFSPDVYRKDEVSSCSSSVSCSNSLLTSGSPGSIIDSTNNHACILDISEEILTKQAVNQSTITKSSLCAPHSQSNQSEAHTLRENLMKGYRALQPFERSLNDQELEKLFEEGYKKYVEKTKLFGNLEFLPADEYNEIYEKTQVDVDGRMKLLQDGRRDMVQIVKEYVQFTHGIPNFKTLSPKDQSTLLKASRFEFFAILQYRALDSEREMMISYTGQSFHRSEICPYTPVEVFRGWFEFARRVKECDFSQEEHALVLAISLTFRDRCSLEEPDKVEEIQTKLIDSLENLLKETHGQTGGRRLAKIMDLFVRLRALGEEYLQLYKTLCKDKLLTKVIPEMLQFLFDE